MLLLPVLISQTAFQSPDHSTLSEFLFPYNQAFLSFGAAIVVAVIASRGPAKWLALGLRSGLDVALDVINWLRLHPLTGNPRARICARYYALLQHIEAWTDARDGGGYDALVRAPSLQRICCVT